jgi:hypothetical protein
MRHPVGSLNATARNIGVGTSQTPWEKSGSKTWYRLWKRRATQSQLWA